MKIKIDGYLNLIYRFGALGSKFVLTIFLAKNISVREFGYYGFISAVVAITPAIFGFGLNYTVCRLVPALSVKDGASMLIRRIAISCASAFVFSIGFYFYFSYFETNSRHGLCLAVLFFCEIVAFDAHYGLISLGRSVLANLLLFIRTGLWVFVFIFLSLIFELNDLFFVMLLCWSIFCMAAIVFYGIYLKCLGGKIGKNVFSWGADILRSNKKIYFSDILISSSANLDRFVVGFILGLEALGVYSFYLMFSNSVQALISGSYIQVEASKLIKAVSVKGNNILRPGIDSLIRSVIKMSITMSAVVLVGVYVCAIYLNKDAYLAYFLGFVVLVFAHNVKLVSEVLNYGLYILNRDVELVFGNVIGVVMTLIPVAAGAYVFGLYGAFMGVALGGGVVLAFRKKMCDKYILKAAS